MRAEEIMGEEFAVVGPDDTLSRALSLFENNDVIVVMEGNNYKGVLLRKEVLRAKIPPSAKVKNFLKYAPKLHKDDTVEKIARLMLESEMYHLPVFDGEKVVGVVGYEAILRHVMEEDLGEERVENFLSRDVITVSPNDNIGKVIKIFREHSISRLPVVDDGKVVGVITLRDIIDKVIHPEEKPEYGEFIAEKKRYLKISVKGIMTDEPLMMPPSSPLREVIKEMLERGIGGMLVGEGKKLVGIITVKDILEPLASRKEEKTFIQFCGETDEIEDFDREEGMAHMRELLRKYSSVLEDGFLYVYLKKYRERKHGLPHVHCRIRATTPHGIFVASRDGWGFIQALKNAVRALEKQMERVKGK